MTEACLLLLQHGAVIDAPTGRPHKTTLHIAVAGGHLDLLKILVKKYKADWKVTDDWGWTALHEAAVRGHTDIIRFLMKECRDLVNQKDKLGRTPLLLGLLSGIDEVVTSKANWSIFTKDFDQKAARVLLELGESPSNEDLVGRGCLEAAVLYSR